MAISVSAVLTREGVTGSSDSGKNFQMSFDAPIMEMMRIPKKRKVIPIPITIRNKPFSSTLVSLYCKDRMSGTDY
jgi:hypothetical protein